MTTPPIIFDAQLISISGWTILRLPESASLRLPSRGMSMVKGTLDGAQFQAPLEPDGKKGHWLKVDEAMLRATKAKVGDTIHMEIEPVKDWPEPKVPADLQKALDASSQVSTLWNDITPLARWDWIRWINATHNPETRQKRILVTASKLLAGKRSACCFDRAQCTVPEVSKSGVLNL